MKAGTVLAIGLIVLLAIFAYQYGWFQVPKEDGQPTSWCDTTQTATLKVQAIDKITGSVIDVNAEVWDDEGNQIVTETQVNGVTSLSGIPMLEKGVLYLGNDNYVSTTDRGTEYYYTKIEWDTLDCKGSKSLGNVKLAQEGTPTWTIYDDGVAESSPNITVGQSQTVTSTEFKIEAGDNVFLGNPDFNRPLALCVNGTETSWDEIKPSKHDTKIDSPEFLSGQNILNEECYVLPTGAIKDYGNYRDYLILKAATGENPSETIFLFLLDKTYYKDDEGKWTSGFGYDSVEGSDSDVGFDSISTAKTITIF